MFKKNQVYKKKKRHGGRSRFWAPKAHPSEPAVIHRKLAKDTNILHQIKEPTKTNTMNNKTTSGEQQRAKRLG